ncbi:nucleoside deaminase [bacterium]|nr:nucleoside deaminase [bacterium]
MEKDLIFMREALSLAAEAASSGEVPVGALVVRSGEVIARGRNRVEERQSALAHAELLALEEASAVTGNWRLSDCTLYVSLEPCTMCASAIRLSRLSRVVYGAPDLRLGGFGSFLDLSSATLYGQPPEIVGGVLAEESARALRVFFQARRKENVSDRE